MTLSVAIPGLSAKKLMEFTTELPPKIAIIGPAMSAEVSVVGQITPVFNLIEMNFVATTSTIKERSIYSSLYTVNYIQDDLNPLRIAMMKYFHWERVATIVFDNEIFNSQYNARIIFGAFRTNTAPYVFCEAYKQGLYGRKFVWILPGAAMYLNWISTLNEDEIPCSKTELLEATKGHFTLSIKRLMEHGNETFSGKTPQEYSDYVNKLVSGTPYLLSRTHPWAFDAAWALALGLNNSLAYLQDAKLEDFDYNRTDIYTAIKKGMDEVSFEGVSGPVSFKNGRRIGYTYLDYNIGSVVPKDRFKYVTTDISVSPTAIICIILINTVGVKVWIMCLGFTTAFGALFSKTWRVHVLFRRNDLRRKRTNTKTKVNDDDNTIETLLYRRCYHEKQIYWLSVQFISKGIMLSFGTFLAWETRMVVVPALNDSKLIGFCVYNIVIMSAFGVPMQYTLPDNKPTVKFILMSMVIIFCTTLVPCILFVPK
ncbi:hypothetical protein KUTeg_023172, partial [Tegillarca granosa]